MPCVFNLSPCTYVLASWTRDVVVISKDRIGDDVDRAGAGAMVRRPVDLCRAIGRIIIAAGRWMAADAWTSRTQTAAVSELIEQTTYYWLLAIASDLLHIYY